MRSLFARLGDIQSCQECKIIKHERYNEVRICAGCKTKERAYSEKLKALSLEGFIREVVNGRASVHDCSKHNYALYEKYQEDMPYGTQKARDGDPDEFITERLYEDYEHLIEEEVET